MIQLDKITTMVYHLLEKAQKGKLDWKPSLESFFNYFFDSTQPLFADEYNEHAQIDFDLYQEKYPENILELFTEIAHRKSTLSQTAEKHLEKKEVYEYDVFPAVFDWRNYQGQNYITNVKHQGFCNSCAAFSVVAAMEAMIHIQSNLPLQKADKAVELSEQHLFFYNPDALSGKCNCRIGWDSGINKALDFGYNSGVLPVDFLCRYNPYNPQLKPPYKKIPDKWNDLTYKIIDYRVIINIEDNPLNMQKKMKSIISHHGPVICEVKMEPGLLFYKNGYYTNEMLEFTGINGYHAVLCVGYDELGWICKNSWGTQWGEKGFFKVKYGECEIEDNIRYLTGVK